MDYSHNYLGKIVAITTGSKDVNEGNINGIFPFFTCSRNHTFSNSYSFDDEALLISGNGDVGNVKYYKGKFEAYQRTYVLTNSILDFKYLYYYLENGLVKYLSSEQSGTTIQFIKLGQLKNFPIVFPYQLEHQKKIAEILTKVDEAIENTEQLIQKYEQVKVGLMQDLLTKGIDENGNIRSEETHHFKDSPLGRIPVEWDFSLIGDICFVTKLSGFEFTKYMKYKEDGEIIALRALNIKNKKIVLNDIQRISKRVSDNLVRSKLFKDDILITYIGAYIGAVAMVHENDKFHLAPNIAKLTAGRRLTPSFLLEILDSEKVQNYFKSLITTTANPSLTMGQIRNTYIIYPKEKLEQEKISLVIKKNVDILDSYINELKKLKNIKQGLMQDLLSGKVRVNY